MKTWEHDGSAAVNRAVGERFGRKFRPKRGDKIVVNGGKVAYVFGTTKIAGAVYYKIEYMSGGYDKVRAEAIERYANEDDLHEYAK